MNHATLKTLITSYNADPGAQGLLMAIVRACLELEEYQTGLELLANQDAGLGRLSPEEQADAAKLCLKGKAPELALSVCLDGDPRCLVLRARALLELDRRKEARDLYASALEKNSALEDLHFEALLEAKAVEQTCAGKGKVTHLRVMANGDGDEPELNRLLAPPEQPVTFEDVGGLDGIKQQIRRKIILPFQKPAIFQKFRKKAGGGILLYGPPGCGKTLLAKATAGECQAAFFSVAISDILDMYVGESERKLNAIFENARLEAPSVIFFDELEAIGGKRRFFSEGASSNLVSQFLYELDGYSQNNQGLLVLGATNAPWAVDPAFCRPGRFDRVFVPPPDREARERIIEIHLKERPVADSLSPKALAKATGGFSGADLCNLVETACDFAIDASLTSGEERPLTSEFFQTALKEVMPTIMEWLTTAGKYAGRANESGQYNDVLEFLTKHGQ
ncbi:ATPase family associated with various cellular activities (AAA) [Desulfatibacillum alkenivorans DSM 16219]|jgi:SpoVK/Ycf46/Vps4 family AAA+-type ATPase|uniref:ATPase family associated with various cellular activities (AAA) n=2 Tax=Desulfatibacillum alkenivorans TaxID=259354 RepID=A0A1M6KKE3_9BACT|nr:ATPase family associated with various cellular activities (AAA) [Desulfatibacillum alkenivorans DSM 16219]